MKRYIHDEIPINIDVVVSSDFTTVAAATYKDIDIPDGPVIDRDKDARITDQMAADYDAFIESLESLLEDHYHFILTYRNESDDYSRYFNFLATDASGIIRFKFRLRLGVSNHKPHRSKDSQKHKKEEESSPKLLELLNSRPTPAAYTKIVIVNSKQYSSYEEAFIAIDDEIAHWVQVMLK